MTDCRCRRLCLDSLHTDLYGITDESLSGGRSDLDVVREMIAAGLRVIQYREKFKSVREKYEECLAIRDVTRRAGVTFIVNDNLDIAVLCKADGVHLGQSDLPYAVAREFVGSEMIIGVSTQSPSEAAEAVAQGADYIGVGPIFFTATKKDIGTPVGLSYMKYVSETYPDLPHVAIGGIKEENLREVVASGARCCCLISDLLQSPNLGEKVKTLRRIILEEQEKSGR